MAHLIKGLDVEHAILHLMYLPRRHTDQIIWALKSGCEIAREVQKVDPSQFYIGNHFLSLLSFYFFVYSHK